MQGKQMIAATLGLAVLTGCGQKSLSTSELSHDMDAGLRTTGHWAWTDVKEDDREAVLIPYLAAVTQNENFKYLPQNHPVLSRIQSWIDLLDENLRSNEEFSVVPKPKVIVSIEDQPNAFVTSVPTCIDVPLRFNADQDSQIDDESIAFLLPGGRAVLLEGASTCIHRDLLTEEIPAFLKWIGSDTSLCPLEYSEDQAAFSVNSDTCKIDPKLMAHESVVRIGYLSSSNHIIVHSGLIENFEEEPLIAVIAHELAHYYRAHAASKIESPEFDFYYSLGDKNHNSRPVPEPGLQALGEKLSKTLTANFRYFRAEGQNIQSEMLLPSVALAASIVKNQVCEENECRCTDFSQTFSSAEVLESLESFPFTPLAPENIKTLLLGEKAILSCLEGVSIGSDKVELGLSVGLGQLVRSLLIDKKLLPFVPKDNPEGKSLLEFLSKMSKTIKNHDLGTRALFSEAADKKIGYYTTEQEADEFSLEWIADIGIAPKRAVDMELALVDLVASMDPNPAHPYAIPLKNCRALSEMNWKDTDGKDIFVPVADFRDPHHSPCYRAYNLSREIVAHDIKAKKQHPALPNQKQEASWADIQAKLKAETKTPDLNFLDFIFAKTPRPNLSVQKKETMKLWGKDAVSSECRFSQKMN